MATQSASDTKTVRAKQRHGVISHAFYAVITFMLISLLAWLVLLLGFGVYRITHGKQALEEKISRMITANLTVLGHLAFFDDLNIFEHQEKQIQGSLQTLNRAIQTSKSYLRQQQNKMNPILHFSNRNPTITLESLKKVLSEATTLLWDVTLIVVSRIIIFLFALPLLLMCLTIGCVDGLVQRDIRKFQAARESTLFFHAVKKRMSFWFFIPVLAYLALPWTVDPSLIIVPMALGLGLLTQLSIQSFKKYL